MLLIALRPIPGPIQILPGQSFYELSEAQRSVWISGGFARPAEMAIADEVAAAPPLPTPRALAGGLPDWRGATVVVIASGPSLTVDQCAHVELWRNTPAPEQRRVITINTSFLRAPWADMLYACDGAWWKAKRTEDGRTHHAVALEVAGAARLWTQDERAAAEFGLNLIRSQAGQGLSRKPGLINQGMNGAYQAMNIAYLAGARRMVLLGVDCKGGHWHGNHPAPLSNSLPHQRWKDRFAVLARDLKAEGVAVVNCSPGTALTAFPTGELEDALPL